MIKKGLIIFDSLYPPRAHIFLETKKRGPEKERDAIFAHTPLFFFEYHQNAKKIILHT